MTASQIHDLTRRDLIFVSTGRLASTTAFRLVYPLLPFIVTQFGVSDLDAASLIAIQTAASFTAPIGGRLADQHGERKVMIAGLGLFILGALLCSVAAAFWVFQVGYLLIGVATSVYLPSGQSYLSARSPYAQRGRILGIFEMSWAVAAIIGVAPLMYLINQLHTVSLAYAVLAVIGVVNALLLTRIPEHQHGAQRVSPLSTSVILRQPAVWLIVLFGFLTFGSQDLFFVSQSAWLKETLGADEAAIGGLFALIGVAELLGSSSVVAYADRIGKRRSVVLGFIASAAAVAALGFGGTSWTVVTVLLFVFYVLIEYAIVASFPLLSETLPHARATMLSLHSVAVGTGRIAASFGSVLLYGWGGMQAVAVMIVVLSMIGLYTLTRSSLTPAQ